MMINPHTSRSVMMNSCVASGVLFSFGFFSPHNFSSLRFLRGVYSRAGHMPKTNYFSVGSPQLVHFARSHSCWMDVSGTCCLYSVYIIFSGSAHKVVAPSTLHMGG